MPFGGATLRLPQEAGWANAMRYLLTGDVFDAQEALRIGLVQEGSPPDEVFDRGRDHAPRIAAQAPLAVQASLHNARLAVESGAAAALEPLMSEARALMSTEDAQEGLQSFLERRDAKFRGE